jgi:hypothetical protein
VFTITTQVIITVALNNFKNFSCRFTFREEKEDNLKKEDQKKSFKKKRGKRDEVTGGRKFFGQNVCSLLTLLEVFRMSQKLGVRTRILCSFRIWVQKILSYSFVENNEIIFQKSKKLVWAEFVGLSFR